MQQMETLKGPTMINLMHGITHEMSTKKGSPEAAKKFGILQLDLNTPVSEKPPEMAHSTT